MLEYSIHLLRLLQAIGDCNKRKQERRIEEFVLLRRDQKRHFVILFCCNTKTLVDCANRRLTISETNRQTEM